MIERLNIPNFSQNYVAVYITIDLITAPIFVRENEVKVNCTLIKILPTFDM